MSGIREAGRRRATRVSTTLIVCVIGGFSWSTAAQSPPRERRVTLSGATNLRDLGGYRTADGRRVRWGLVYRSDQLAQLTDEDYQQLARFGIATVCDFRRDDERDRAPTKWRGDLPPEILVRVPPASGGAAPPDPVSTLTRGGTGDEVAAVMRAGYVYNVTALAPTYAIVLQRIMHGPTLVHCTAGKDRTGIFSALFLLMVGVPYPTVEEDYLLSNTYYGTDARIAGASRSLKTSIEAARALLAVDKSYLLAALKEIDDRYGSLDKYRRTQLAMSDAGLGELKARVLEP
jgi:protein-tyrosine phosphatase